MRGDDSSKIIKKLKTGKATLYFGEGCGACKDQVEKLGLDFGKLKKLSGAHDISKASAKTKNKIKGVPTWVNKFGDHIVGSHSPADLLPKLNEKQNSLSFGFNSYTLAEQPQPNGLTIYGGRRGGALPCNSENLSNWKADSLSYQNTGNFNFGYGGLMERPYGPSDNQNMKGVHGAGSKLYPFPLTWNYKLGQFGSTKIRRKNRRSLRKSRRTRSGRRQSSRKSRKSRTRATKSPPRSGAGLGKSRKKRRSLKKFGSTPGSKSWTSQMKINEIGQGSQWVNPMLAPAKGFGGPNAALLYLPVKESNVTTHNANVPMQYSNNQYNNPQPSSKVMNFGNMPSLLSMEGPNKVGYNTNINMYQGAGGNTTNWSTGKTFLPSNKAINKVQKTVNNPTGYLSNNSGIIKASSGNNTARRYTNLGMLGFGSDLVYTRNNQGSKTLYQPKPPYMKESVNGSYASFNTFGKKKKSQPKKAIYKKKKKKKLMTNFGGQTITLDSNGKITISDPPKVSHKVSHK